MESKTSILVTGGLGYIGCHTVVELIEAGFKVVIVDNLSNSRIEILEQIESITGEIPVFYQIDLLEKDKLRAVFENEKIEGAIHFAAHLQVGESVQNPIKYYQNNLGSLLNLLEVMEDKKVSNFIFSSSCTVYGNPEIFPVTEETPIGKASSPYGTTKIFGEKIMEDVVHASNQLSAISLRYFNPVGAHSSGLIGELTNNGSPAHLFPILAEAIRLNQPFKVFGKDYPTKDGTPVRDYIHVVDLAKAHVLALQKQLAAQEPELTSYNLGTGKGLSVLEIIQAFEKVTESKLQLTAENRREGDVEAIWAESQKANQELNWKPIYDIEKMVTSAVEWNNYQVSRGWV